MLDRFIKVENHFNNVKRRLTNLKNSENKVKDIEDCQDFLSEKYELQNQKIGGIHNEINN